MTVPAHDGEPEFQCVPHTPLVGTCTGRGFVNGGFYEGVEVNSKCFNIKDKTTGEVFEVTPEVVSKHAALGWAVV